jgi:hypothetical protein
MSIKSNAFGRVTLTGADARKFRNQATYGKPKAAAARHLKEGLKMMKRSTSTKGKFVFNIDP